MSDRALRAVVALVALAGVAVAGYLTYVHYQPDALICTSGGGCETVQESSYAELAGIPVALLGLLGYVAVLLLVAWDSELAWTLAAAIALTAAGHALEDRALSVPFDMLCRHQVDIPDVVALRESLARFVTAVEAREDATP